MANSPSTIGVDDAATPDKYIWTYSWTVGGTASQEQVYVPGPRPWPTYNLVAASCTLATANSHLLFVQADGTNYSRVQSIRVAFTSLPTAAATATISLLRVSTVGSGGTALSFGARDSSDTYGGTAQQLPSSLGTEGAVLDRWRLIVPTNAATVIPPGIAWNVEDRAKEFIFGTATTAGLALKNTTAIAGCTVDITVGFITTSFL